MAAVRNQFHKSERKNSSWGPERIQSLIAVIGIAASFFIAAYALYQTQRPWLSATDVAVIRDYDVQPDQHFSFSVNINVKNTGLSTARKGTYYADARAGQDDDLGEAWDLVCKMSDKIGWRKGARYQTGFVIAPGQTEGLRITVGNNDITHENFKTNHFWFMGCLTYRDAFYITHHTRFCFTSSFTPKDADMASLVACGQSEVAN